MATIAILDDHRPAEHLATLDIYRKADGSIMLGVTYMADNEIELRGTISERFAAIAEWIGLGVPSLSEQASEYGEQQ